MMLIGQDTRVVVQGITGHQGRFHTKAMLDYGTKVIAGVTPGKAGESVEGVPVFDSISDIEGGPTASMIFVPARFAKAAIMEAIDAGLDPIVPITEHVPVHDAMECIAYAKKRGVNIVGPNTPGLISVGACKMGIMPNHIFLQGDVAVISRSGTLTYEVVAKMTSSGIGQSTVIGLGGDPITGLDFVSALDMLAEDGGTKAVVLLGEIGGDGEELAARHIMDSYDLPVVAYVAGRTAPPGKTMGHAGAIVSGNSGTYDSKATAFKDAGVPVAGLPKDIIDLVAGVL